MSGKERVSSGVRGGSRRFLAKAALRLSLGVLLLSGVLHATPITTVGESQLQDSKQLASRGVAATRTKEQAAAGDAAGAATTNKAAVAQADASVCIFSSDCYRTVEVPEPQSLALVGSGLLSMAGLIRRRLLR